MVHDTIATVERLSACIGKLPDAVRDIKVIDHLDAGAMRWLAASPLLLAGLGCQRNGAPDIDICLAGAPAGFITAPDPSRLSIPLASLDASELPLPGASFGGLFLVPSLDETLRVTHEDSYVKKLRCLMFEIGAVTPREASNAT